MIRTSVHGDLHEEVYYLPGGTIGAPKDAGRQHQHHTVDTKQPIQADLLVTLCMPCTLETVNHSPSLHPPLAQPIPLQRLSPEPATSPSTWPYHY